MLDLLLTYGLGGLLILGTVIPYLRRRMRKDSAARKRFEELKIAGLHEATTMHPHIDITSCIGCGACVKACPEEDVLGIIAGKAALIHGAKCVGHGLCATVCPVGAIELLLATPGRSALVPMLDPHLQSSVPGVYIIGELGGQGLIRNAVQQGVAAIVHIAACSRDGKADYDVAIVGAGPGGLAAGLAAKERGLRYVLLEQGEIGGAILHYPRAKVVMTQPLELPLYGKVRLNEIPKEEMVALWRRVIDSTGLEVNTGQKVEQITPQDDGTFTLTSTSRTVRAATVILALGRRGTPRKIGVTGEELPKVMYRLIDTTTYTGRRIVVIGGGDSAVESATGLSMQPGNQILLSYRRSQFTRIKDRNRSLLEKQQQRGQLRVVLDSEVTAIRENAVELRTPNGTITVPNDFVFIFAGGEFPFSFLERIGIQMQHQVA